VEKTEPKRKVSDRGKYSNQAYPILSVIKDSQWICRVICACLARADIVKFQWPAATRADSRSRLNRKTATNRGTRMERQRTPSWARPRCLPGVLLQAIYRDND